MIIKKKSFSSQYLTLNLLFLMVMFVGFVVSAFYINQNSQDIRTQAQTGAPSLKLGTFVPQATVTPTPTVKISTTTRGLITGGPVAPNAPYYCIDDVDPEGCDDNTAFWVPKGTGGISGSCGTVIEQSHKIVASLPQGLKDFRDKLNPAVTNCGYTTGVYSGGYISTFFVIDSYNLSGYRETSKTNTIHVLGANLLNWWRSQTTGYKFIPYSPSALQQHASGQQDLTGCVMFLNISSGVHVGIVNALEIVDTHGNGIISILQSGARYFIDRFEVVGWSIINTPLHQTQLNSVIGFGCH